MVTQEESCNTEMLHGAHQRKCQSCRVEILFRFLEVQKPRKNEAGIPGLRALGVASRDETSSREESRNELPPPSQDQHHWT